MREQIEQRLRELARRAGISGAPPAVVAAALGVCLIVVLCAAWRWWPRDLAAASSVATTGTELPARPSGAGSGPTSESAIGADESSTASSSSAVYVHVIGAVRRPGMYEVEAGARVADAVMAAGGLLANAAQAGVNLARVVSDGEQISVPTVDELARGVVSEATGGGGASRVSPQDSGAAGTQALVNINTADATALDTLPGVGPSTATKIVAEREANGPFSSADDLGRVAGIGPKKLEELKPRVCVR